MGYRTAGRRLARADAERLLPPTLILEPGDDAKAMQDEIFGPILPILGYTSLDDAIADLDLPLVRIQQRRRGLEELFL